MFYNMMASNSTMTGKTFDSFSLESLRMEYTFGNVMVSNSAMIVEKKSEENPATNRAM